jgi:hypothetical protein
VTISVQELHDRLASHGGEVFTQIRGGTFHYTVDQRGLSLSRTRWTIPWSHLEEALSLVPLENTRPVQHLYGPSYIYAILNDRRIRLDDW